MSTITCPDCRGRKVLMALVDGPAYSGPAEIACLRCGGAGEVDEDMERWMMIGGTHRTWRVAQHEALGECARRLSMSASELSGMEHGRTDPTRLLADIPEILQPKIKDNRGDRIAPREQFRRS